MKIKYLGASKDFKYKTYDFAKGPCEVPNDEAIELVTLYPRGFIEVMAKVVNIKPKDVTAKVTVKGTVAGSKATVKPKAA